MFLKRIWNIVNPSIYSLSSFDNEGEQNFNICSYVSVVSLKPKLYMIAIETNKTYSTYQKVRIQVLSMDNVNIVKYLGKKGWNINKLNFTKEKFVTNMDENHKNSCGVILLEKTNHDNKETIHYLYSEFKSQNI